MRMCGDDAARVCRAVMRAFVCARRQHCAAHCAHIMRQCNATTCYSRARARDPLGHLLTQTAQTTTTVPAAFHVADANRDHAREMNRRAHFVVAQRKYYIQHTCVVHARRLWCVTRL